MCMIAHRPTGKNGKGGSNMPNEVLETAIRRHADGFGLAWRDAEGLHVRKFGPKDAHKFRKLLKRVDKRHGVEYVAHFRMATHGIPCEELAHPFSYDDPGDEGTVFVFHNGIVNLSVDRNGVASDTSIFVDSILTQLPSAWWRNSGLTTLVDLAGGWSKFVLMTETETVNLNTDDGNWDGGIWYSSDHRPDKPEFTGSWSGKGYTPYGAGYDSDDEGWEGRVNEAYDDYDPKDTAALIGVRRAESDRFAGSASAKDTMWFHGGHKLDVVVEIDRSVDGDYPDSILCSQCFTIGDAYIIDGMAYIDLAHQLALSDEYEETRA